MSWRKVKLSEIFDIARGGSPRPIDSYLTDAPDAINWISIKDASESGKYIRSTKLKIKPEGASKSRLVKPGDFLLTNSMSFGRPYIMQTTGCIHDGWLVLSDKSGNVDPDFLYYLLGSPQMYKEFAKRAAGAVVKNLNIDLVKGVSIPLPPLEVQKKIAAVLEKADTLRRKREEQIKRLDDLLQATFLDMFGDPVTNPKGWDMIKLGEISHKITDGVHAKPNYTTKGKPFISVVNITSGKIVFDNCKFVSEEDFKTFTKVNKPEYGDILYTKVGATYGIPAFVDVHDDFCLYVSVCLIKPNHNLINSRFLAESMRMPYIKRQADNRIKGIGVPDLHLNQIREFDICYPPKALQQKFVDFCSKLEKKREQLKNQFDKQNNLFNSLMQRAFKGELELK